MASIASAVRHGWPGDNAMNAGAAQILAAVAAKQRSDVLLGHIDLPDFVRAAIAAETGQKPASPGTMRLPADWSAGLDDLPGFDPEHRVLRFTRDHSRLRDARGRSLAVLGRAHPVVRRAISSVQRLAGRALDNRVSVALAKEGAPLAVLLTFGAEMRSCGACRVQADRRGIIACEWRPGGD